MSSCSTRPRYAANVQYAVSRQEAPTASSGQRMKETAGEECEFRDGWKAFSNCANFRPHMSVNLPKPVHSVSPLASIKPPLCVCLCVCVCVCGYVIYFYFSVCPNQPECTRAQRGRIIRSHNKSRLCVENVIFITPEAHCFNFLRREFKSSRSHSWKGRTECSLCPPRRDLQTRFQSLCTRGGKKGNQAN